jgi:hypothetical protein
MAVATGCVVVISWQNFHNGLTFARGEALENVSYSDVYNRCQYLNQVFQTNPAKPPAYGGQQMFRQKVSMTESKTF